MTRHVVECATCDCTVTRDHHTRYPDHATIAMTLEDAAPDDRQAVITAVLKAAREHGNVISANHVRPHVPATVTPQRVGPIYTALIREGVLEDLNRDDRSNDRQSGNAGKKIPLYKVHPERLAA